MINSTIFLKLIFLVFLLLAQYSTIAQAPTWQWAKQAGGKSDDLGRRNSTDASGNVYITGSFTDTAYFDSIVLVNNLPFGSVIFERKISDTQGNFTGILDNFDLFGNALASVGDLDGDGITDLAVGAYRDDDGGSDIGALYILFMNTDGTVRAHQKISATQGNFTGLIGNSDRFAVDIINSIGDLDGDGVIDIAVGAYLDDDGGTNRGAVWILFLNPDGTVKTHQKISDTQGNFTGILDNDDRFGVSIGTLGDLDGDGVTDIVVGADHDYDGGFKRGAVWILFLNTDGMVKSHQKISSTEGNFTGLLSNNDQFSGSGISSIGDLDGDGITEIAVAASLTDDGGFNRGAVWILFLNADGTVRTHQKISDTEGNFNGILANSDRFGFSISCLNDLNGDGIADIAVGAVFDDDGGTNRGAVWILFLNTDGTVKSHQKISSTQGNFTGTSLDDGDAFGTSLALLGDIDGDGMQDLVVGAPRDDDGGTDRGAVWLLSLKSFPVPLLKSSGSGEDGHLTDGNNSDEDIGLTEKNNLLEQNNENELHSSINIYPNPAKDELYIFVNNKDKKYMIKIINLLGQEVFRKRFVKGITIDVSDFQPKGLYFIEVMAEDGNERITRKIVIE